MTSSHSCRISFEKQTLKDCQDRIDRLQKAIDNDNVSIKKLEKEKEKHAVEQTKIEESITRNQGLLAHAQDEAKAAMDQLEEAKKELDVFIKENETQSRAISTKESEIERLLAERLSMLRRCKLEEIDIPLEDAQSLQDISLEDIESHTYTNDMDVDGPVSQLEKIKINFAKLRKEHKQNKSSDVDAKFREDIRVLSLEIEKLAPHSRAIEKFGDIQNKLRMTSEEFENSRKEAKDAKDRFVAVKNER